MLKGDTKTVDQENQPGERGLEKIRVCQYTDKRNKWGEPPQIPLNIHFSRISSPWRDPSLKCLRLYELAKYIPHLKQNHHDIVAATSRQPACSDRSVGNRGLSTAFGWLTRCRKKFPLPWKQARVHMPSDISVTLVAAVTTGSVVSSVAFDF